MKSQTKELVRYVMNGLVATAVHYAVLNICIEYFNIGSAGISNLLASTVGITCTFLGNRYFVFRCYDQAIIKQVIKFVGLYISIALLNGIILFLWTDQLGYNYKIGFLLSLSLQAILSYFFSKKYVFPEKNLIINNSLDSERKGDTSFSYSGIELESFSTAINWKAYWSNNIRPFLGDEVLDVGAGIGATVIALNHKSYCKWIALEPDKVMCSLLEKMNINYTLGSGFKVVNGTSSNLHDQDTFDTILYIDVLEHIEDDCRELAHVQHHLVEGGYIIIVAPAHNFLYTPFDKKIGHYRRYNKRMLRSLMPENMVIKKICYLDSVGLLASLANKFLIKTDTPSYKQIQVWDNFMVRPSRWVDFMTGYMVGKSIVCVLEKKTAKAGYVR